MNQYKIVKLSNGFHKVKKTKNPNAKCIKCGKKFFSAARTLGFDGLSCKDCSTE